MIGLPGGKCEGMPAMANTPNEKVRQLQRKLCVCAKQSKTRRFHALYDRIYRSDVLREAWKRVRSNGGAAGIDGETIQAIEQRGVETFLKEIEAALRAGRYRPSPVKRRWIPKADGKQRPLGMVRYADDFVAMCRTESGAREALRRIGLVMNRLGLTLHPAKRRLVNLRRGKEGFEFLGCTIRKKRSIQRAPDKHFMQRWPSPKARTRLRDRVRELTGKRQSGQDVKQIVAELTPVLRGWGNYFRTGTADREFNKMDRFVVRSVRRWQYRRGGQRAPNRPPFTGEQLYGMGLHKLMGTVKYPAQATPRRSSLSRVRENRTHGLKGVLWKRAGITTRTAP